MRQKIFTAFAAFLVILFSCKGVDESQIEFAQVKAEKTVSLSNEAMSPKCSVSLAISYATEANGHRAEVINNTVSRRLLNISDMSMQAAADEFAEQYTHAYLKHMLPLYNQDRADTTKRAWYEYHYVITTETHPGCKGIVVYLANVNTYEGGAHGNHQQVVMNFNVKTGQILSLNDVFVEGYEPILNSILLKALKTKVGVSTLSALKDRGYLVSMDIYPPKNFILDEETVTFVYNPSEIAPYTVGPTELTVPYSELVKIIKNSFQYE